MKYEITVEDGCITNMRPVENKFQDLCIGPVEANGMANAMLILKQFLEKEKQSETIKRMIEIAENYSETLKYLAKQLGCEDEQAEKSNER